MKRIFINMHYMAIGGAERALLGLLYSLDPQRGVMRLPQIGRMLNFEMPWDGVFLMDRLVRCNTLWGPLR